MNLKEIENNNRVAKSRRKMAGFSDKRWMEEIDWLIAEVKRLRGQIVKKDKKIERIKLLIEQAISIIESSVLDPSWPEVLAQKSCNKKWIERVSDEFGRD